MAKSLAHMGCCKTFRPNVAAQWRNTKLKSLIETARRCHAEGEFANIVCLASRMLMVGSIGAWRWAQPRGQT
eukprot:4545516-Amphidinium_carterae.1